MHMIITGTTANEDEVIHSNNAAMIDKRELAKTIEYIKSKLTEEEYAELREKHNFNVTPINITVVSGDEE